MKNNNDSNAAARKSLTDQLCGLAITNTFNHSFMIWCPSGSYGGSLLIKSFDPETGIGVAALHGNRAFFGFTLGEERTAPASRDYRREIPVTVFEPTTEVEGDVIVAGIGDKLRTLFTVHPDAFEVAKFSW